VGGGRRSRAHSNRSHAMNKSGRAGPSPGTEYGRAASVRMGELTIRGLRCLVVAGTQGRATEAGDPTEGMGHESGVECESGDEDQEQLRVLLGMEGLRGHEAGSLHSWGGRRGW